MLNGVSVPVPFGRAPGGEWHRSVPLLAQGVPGLMDAIPVTSPPVVGGSGGSLQQAERTRAEETLSRGGNAKQLSLSPHGPRQQGRDGVAIPKHNHVPFPFPTGTGSRGDKGKKGGEHGLKGDVGTSSIVGPGSVKGEKVGEMLEDGGCW